jgi:hypothetical protein
LFRSPEQAVEKLQQLSSSAKLRETCVRDWQNAYAECVQEMQRERLLQVWGSAL